MRILFLCTGNSARSILAEALFNRLAGGRHEAVSAGSDPKGQVHPGAVRILQAHGFAAGNLHSKNWHVFADAKAPPIDLVITLCDSAASEICPVWPGHPMQIHWGLPDPAAVTDDSVRTAAFQKTAETLETRLTALLRILDRAERNDAWRQEVAQLVEGAIV